MPTSPASAWRARARRADAARKYQASFSTLNAKLHAKQEYAQLKSRAKEAYQRKHRTSAPPGGERRVVAQIALDDFKGVFVLVGAFSAVGVLISVIEAWHSRRATTLPQGGPPHSPHRALLSVRRSCADEHASQHHTEAGAPAHHKGAPPRLPPPPLGGAPPLPEELVTRQELSEHVANLASKQDLDELRTLLCAALSSAGAAAQHATVTTLPAGAEPEAALTGGVMLARAGCRAAADDRGVELSQRACRAHTAV